MKNFTHGGHIRELASRAGIEPEKILDFSANINPVGPPEWLRAVVSAALSQVIHYPDPDASRLKESVADRYRAHPDTVLVGNGSTELIYLIPRAVKKSRALIPVPSYADYVTACRLAGLDVETLPLGEEESFELHLDELEDRMHENDLVFLGHPNNPTGLPLDTESLLSVAVRRPDCLFVVDEAFVDLAEGVPGLAKPRPSNVIVLISLTKTYAIPGLRLGCAIADTEVARAVEDIQPPWSVSGLAQAVGCAALADRGYVDISRRTVTRERERLYGDLTALPDIHVYPGAANFLLARVDRKGLDAYKLASLLLSDGIAIRVCANFEGLDERYFRVAVRSGEENARLLDSLKRALRIGTGPSKKPRAKAIMFQGASSNAGKSVLTAALCRILLQDGYRVAPFKSQNMSLNSFVTRTGGEMGRAQVVQAQACRLEPDVSMNPILLKPTTDVGSQVILRGTPVGNMNVDEYIRFKPTAFKAACECFDSLANEFDAVVLEGAGSPAEVNLKHHDIVNMHMARYAGSPVIIVGDIDRGGVFASFVGTMEVLAEWERNLVAGFVVNRFRGQADILEDAFSYTERHTGRPVLGLVPFLSDLGLPEEDSVTFKSGFFNDATPTGDHVEIAVIDLPHISNFTDFDALRIEPDVRLRIIRSPEELNRPDAVILPGSKNVPGDLSYLREKGFDRRIEQLVGGEQSEIVGLCGGFQMIGEEIADPHRIESHGATIPGLGFLKMTTVMAVEKTLTRVDAVHLESGKNVYGYEIHHGRTESEGLEPLLKRGDGVLIGVRSSDSRLWGTYLHGIFDADAFRRWFIDRLRVRRGLEPLGRVCAKYDLEPAFDRLADVVRQGLQMEAIYRIMGL